MKRPLNLVFDERDGVPLPLKQIEASEMHSDGSYKASLEEDKLMAG